MADNDKKPNDNKGGDEVTAPEPKIVNITSHVKVSDLPEFQAQIDAEKQRVKELEGKLKTEADARQKAEQDKATALQEVAKHDEEKRLAQVERVRTKYGTTIPEDALKTMNKDALDHLDKAPAPTPMPPTPPEQPRSKAPPNGQAPATEAKKRKKQTILNKDGLADHVIQTKGERELGKHRKAAEERCAAIEEEIGRAIRERTGNLDE